MKTSYSVLQAATSRLSVLDNEYDPRVRGILKNLKVKLNPTKNLNANNFEKVLPNKKFMRSIYKVFVLSHMT